MMVLELAMAIFIVVVGVRSRRPLIVFLALAQTGLLLWFELTHGGRLEVSRNLMLDKFSIIMALIISLVGGAICFYAIGYMREFHEVYHPEMRDRRPLFFGLLLIFLGAMFGVVFSNNLLWLYFFWEVTTLCSFLLIGYKQDETSRNNALRALVMNLGGGLAFAAGIVLCYERSGKIELDILVAGHSAALLAPAALLCLAGLTKSAQYPFASWLLGAMVAPTPVSALLHSAAMVKAGVYLIMRMAPALQNTTIGLMVALVGSITFMVGSFAAIGASDAKKVLAHSTIANLGLIVLCGGIGTYEAVWAGILLIIFHAIAKALLFLCVGVVEHKLHSRDIEAMGGLVISMPRISVMLQIGMAGMFLAPFGMLISKWAVLKAVVDAHPLLVIFIAFGSAATLFFWVKWMGKLLEVVQPHPNVEKGIQPCEWISLSALTLMTAMTCILFPLISGALIEPYVVELYGKAARMDHGNMMIMLIMLAMISLFPLSFLNYGRRVKVNDAYLGGANLETSSVRFQGALGQAQSMQMKNYYLGDYLSEAWMLRLGVALCSALVAALVITVLL
jgi:ech hydrogenase subunit A